MEEETQSAEEAMLEESAQRIYVPAFEGELSDVVGNIVSWVDKSVERKIWTNDELEEKFGRRSAYDILEEGDTHYMGPCLDLTLPALEAVKQSVAMPSLVIEEHKAPWFPFNRLHFAIEFIYGGERYYLDFEKMTTVTFGRGSYENPNKKIELVKVMRVAGERISPMEPLHVSLGLASPEEFGDMFVGYRFREPLDRIMEDNTNRKYEAFLRAVGGDLSLNLADKANLPGRMMKHSEN